MKRAALWVVGAGVTSVALMFALRAQEQQIKPSSTAAATVAPATAPKGPEKVAFTFADDTQLQQFGQLWQQRQASVAKMAVLQSYFKEEQANLGRVNQELLSRYNIDVNKNYTFDAACKVLLEQATPPQQLGDSSQQGAGQAAPAAASNASVPAAGGEAKP